MSSEELLKPRYEVIADYPNSIFKIGEMLEKQLGLYLNVEHFNKYPHLFRKLEWWEHREESDMPEYLKCPSNLHPIIYPVFRVEKWSVNGNETAYKIDNKWVKVQPDFLPATETEYLNYINQNNV